MRSPILTYVVEGRPLVLNTERKLNRYARAAHVKTWREASAIIAMQWGRRKPLEWCEVEITPILRGQRKQDTGACFPTAKAMIDGLVDAGVIEDDGPDVVRTLTFRRPIFGADADGVEIAVYAANVV